MFSFSLPSRCGVCAAWPARPVCACCLRRFAAPRLRCVRCALPVPAGASTCGACLREPPPLSACHAAVAYGYPWSGLVARFKFQGEAGWARSFARLMRDAASIDAALAASELVLPMPLSPGRLAARGFNQAMELARRLAPRDKVAGGLLLRLRDTAPQAALGRAQRWDNLRGAFGVDPLAAAGLRGRRVLLVDDVMTSGASLFSAAAALRQAGCADVAAAVFARTDAPG